MVYRFVQGIDYGPRSTLQHPGVRPTALEYHMSEGGDELVSFLARHPGETITDWHSRVNGVSCSVAILSTGEVVQMVRWDHVNGNLNPADRAGEYGYYGHSTLVAVLGAPEWQDPNVYSLSAEIAGHRDAGPTDKQVAAAIAWGKEMRTLFPTIRGAYGHHDQSPKPCPGVTPNMRSIFDGVGGHGLFLGGANPVYDVDVVATNELLVDIPAGTQVLNLDGSARLQSTVGRVGVLSPFATTSTGGTQLRAIVWTAAAPTPDRMLAVYTNAIKNPRPTADCTTQVKAEHDKVKAAAVAAAQAIP